MSNRIEHTIQIEAEPDVVFGALTTPDLLRRWLCHEAQVEPRVGGKVEMTWSAQDGRAPIRYEGAAEILDIAPGKLLAFRMAESDGPGPDSVVEFRIDAANGSSNLTLSQTGFAEDEGGKRARDAYSRGWLASLAVLRSLLEDEPANRLQSAAMHRDITLPGQDPCGIAWDGRNLWVSDAGRGRIFRLDAVSGRVLGSFVFDGEPSGLAWDGESLWQGDREERVVIRVDPRSGRELKRLELEHVKGDLTGVAWDGQHLWIGDGGEDEGHVLEVNPRSGIVVNTLDVTPGVSGLAWDGSALWVGEFDSRVVTRTDPRTGQVLARVAVMGHPTGLTWDGERLWYADAEWKLASRILDKLI